MTVDFTEAAGAGSTAGWRTAAYAPIFHLEFFGEDRPRERERGKKRMILERKR